MLLSFPYFLLILLICQLFAVKVYKRRKCPVLHGLSTLWLSVPKQSQCSVYGRGVMGGSSPGTARRTRKNLVNTSDFLSRISNQGRAAYRASVMATR